MERFLYRLSRSDHGERFILKGALMLRVWNSPVQRPTMDIDLLGKVSNRPEDIATDASLDFQLPFDSYEGPLQVMAQQCASGFREAVVAADTRPLTDDWAPVEHMVDWELLARRARP
jgi:hypothetical protein